MNPEEEATQLSSETLERLDKMGETFLKAGEAGRAYRQLLKESFPASRELSLALTRLEEGELWLGPLMAKMAESIINEKKEATDE